MTSAEISREQLAALNIRTKVDELNAAVSAADKLGVRTEFDTHSLVNIRTGEIHHITAKIMKVL